MAKEIISLNGYQFRDSTARTEIENLKKCQGSSEEIAAVRDQVSRLSGDIVNDVAARQDITDQAVQDLMLMMMGE